MPGCVDAAGDCTLSAPAVSEKVAAQGSAQAAGLTSAPNALVAAVKRTVAPPIWKRSGSLSVAPGSWAISGGALATSRRWGNVPSSLAAQIELAPFGAAWTQTI